MHGKENSPKIVLISRDILDSTVAERIYKLQRAAYAVEAALIGASMLPPLRETVEQIQNTTDKIWAVVVDHAPVAAVFIEEALECVFINKLFVHPNYFRRGFARKILKEVLKSYAGCTIRVSTAKKNMPARNLYEALGFKLEQENTQDGIELVRLILIPKATLKRR